MQAWVLGQRALREAWRTPEAIVPTLFIPLFFLVVNVGQAGKIFPSTSTEFLEGQGYGAFQLPQSLLLAASFGTAALFLVEDIEGGYFDKLRATPISRTSIVLGRLIAEFVKALLISVAIVVLGVAFGIEIASGPLGFVLLILLTALWAVVFVGFMQLIALKTRSAAATNSGGLVFFPLLFLTPNFVPRDLLTDPMEIAASLNPVTYVMESLRSLILVDLDWGTIWPGFLVVAAAGALDAVPERAADQPLRLSTSTACSIGGRARISSATCCCRRAVGRVVEQLDDLRRVRGDDAGAEGGDPLGVRGAIDEQRQERDRDARGERLQRPARAAVADHRRRVRHHLGLRHPALDAHVRRQRAELARLDVMAERHQDPLRDLRERLGELAEERGRADLGAQRDVDQRVVDALAHARQAEALHVGLTERAPGRR